MKTFKEYEQIARWVGIGLLKQIPEHQQFACAVLLEGQRLYNESLTEDSNIAQFKRLSIPLVRRIFNKVVDGQLELEGSTTPCKKWHVFEGLKLPGYQEFHNLDVEAEACAVLSAKISEAMADFGKIKMHCLGVRKDGTLMMNYD